jgi:hypothetical protein
MTDAVSHYDPDEEPQVVGPSIHQALAAILDELPAVGKDQSNVEQGFAFRGIDDVLVALNPLLGKHGVFFAPTVLERVYQERRTQRGSVMHNVNLHVRYTFYGPTGDSITADGWGEGTDMGDKATPKAMTGAMKYVLNQVFAIATREQSEADADRHSPEDTVPGPSADDLRALSARITGLDADHRSLLALEWRQAGLPVTADTGHKPVLRSLRADDLPAALGLVDQIEALQSAAPKGGEDDTTGASDEGHPAAQGPGRPAEGEGGREAGESEPAGGQGGGEPARPPRRARKRADDE